MRTNHFNTSARRRAILMSAGATSLAVLLAGPAYAQAAQPTAYSSATRYDGAGRVVGTIAPDPDGAGPLGYAATRTRYNAVGQKVQVETGELSAWQPTSVVPNAWPGFTVLQTQDFAYDTMGRLVRTRTSGSDGQPVAVTDTNYDRAGRPACTAVRMNPAAFASLPANACFLGDTGAQGADRITRKHHDGAGQLTAVQQGYGTALVQTYASYTYSPNGQQTSVTDANNNRAELRYDGHDRQTFWIFPSKTTPGQANLSDYEQYAYDENGNRIALRKRDGANITYAYDALNRITSKSVPGTASGVAGYSVHYGHDLRGLQTSARFGSPSGPGVTVAYDGHGRLLSSTGDSGGTARTLSYAHDANGNRTRVTHPDGAFFTYEHDGLNRPVAVRENGATPIAGFSYNAAGGTAVQSQNGAASSYGYDPAGRLASLAIDLAGSVSDQTLGFGYNRAGQVVQKTSANAAYASNTAYNVSRGHSVNGLNQYTQVGPNAYAYDLNGNLAEAGTASYKYDAENRLVSVSGDRNATLGYDPLGRLLQVSTGSATRQFLYDGDELVAEYDGGGAMVDRYVHGSRVDDPIAWYEGFGLGQRRSLHADHQGSIVAVADAFGNTLAVNGYDAWGIPNEGQGTTNLGRFQYTGQAYLSEIGLYHYKARIYSPTLGRFLQTDPIGYEDNVNLYGYVGNDPVNKIDPKGLYEVDVHHALTMVLARAAGVSASVSRQISRGNQGVDDNPATSPMGMSPVGRAVRVRSDYHFTSGERREQLWSNFKTSGKAGDLGVFLHAQQDSYSHQGYGPRLGHLSAGHGPDKTFNDVTKANSMALDTYRHIVAARETLGQTGRVVPWEQISSSVNAFNAAQSDADKFRILKNMDGMIRRY